MSPVGDAPFVSVVVPVWNDHTRLRQLLDSLMNQSYPASRREIIVVDNRSTDGSDIVAKTFAVRVLTESSVQSSYAARNRGIEAAKGSILAFTDSDCIPVQEWLGSGVRALNEQDADLAGGRVRFFFSHNATGAELFDSVSNMQIEHYISDRGVAITANLFARAEVFEQIGLFPGDVQSGGDLAWTGRASRSGYRLIYAPDAEVAHPARRLPALVRKQYRVGKGQIAIRTDQMRRPRKVLNQAVGTVLRTQTPGELRDRLEARGDHIGGSRLARMWCACVTATVATAAGNLAYLTDAAKLRSSS